MMHRSYLEQNKRVTSQSADIGNSPGTSLLHRPNRPHSVELLARQLVEERGVTEELKESTDAVGRNDEQYCRSQAEVILMN